MSVKGMEHAGVPKGPDPLRTDVTGGTEPSQDRPEMSNAARSLSGVEAPPVTRRAESSVEAITADRIRTILTRVSEGFYDRPEQQREIAVKLLSDLRQVTTS